MPCIDPWALGLSCDAGHRWFVEPHVDARDSAKAAAARFPELDALAPADVASFWLGEPRARTILNEQVAQLLRTILEGTAPEHVAPAAFCALCASRLAPAEVPGTGLHGLSCDGGHVWMEARLGLHNVQSLGEELVLRPELSLQATTNLVRWWATPNPRLDSNMHESIRRVLASSKYATHAIATQ